MGGVGPAAAAAEDRYSGVLGYPADCDGDITNGGSVANLSGIVTALDTCGLSAGGFAKAVIMGAARRGRLRRSAKAQSRSCSRMLNDGWRVGAGNLVVVVERGE